MGRGLLMRLSEDHVHLKDLLDDLESTSDRQTDKRDEKFGQLYSDISAHMRAEEEVFYPRLKAERKSAEEDVAEGFEEHHVARQAFEELDGMARDDKRWKPLLSVVTEMVEHHIAEEQAILFKHAEHAFSKSELEQMAQEFDEIRGPDADA